MSDTTPVPTLPFSTSVRAGDWLIVSGQLGLRDNALVEGGITPQTTVAIENLAEVLKANGATLAHVKKALVFLADMTYFAEMNLVYGNAFAGSELPARTCVAVAGLPQGGLLEIEAWAWLGE
jgi:2-iminobutanoate/2-iminopropanoate deaminase